MLELLHKGPVLGIGVDIVSVDRIRGVLERQGERFLKRTFTASEIAYCSRYTDPCERYAVRFAAKDAVSKAFTVGIGEYLDWKSVGVTPGERGEPIVDLDSKGERLLARLGGRGVAVSLSHSRESAIAFAAVLG